MAILEAELRPKTRMTEEEFLRMPDTGRKWELVDGEAREVPTNENHAPIACTLIALLMPFVRGRGFLTCGQAGQRMRGGNIRVPDVSFVRKEKRVDGKPSKSFGPTAGDLCVEIISLSEERAEMACKVGEYFESGASLVWQIYPEAREVIIYTSPTEARTLGEEASIDAGDLLPGFSCTVAELLEWD